MVYFEMTKDRRMDLLNILDEDIPETLVPEGHMGYPQIQKQTPVEQAWIKATMGRILQIALDV